MGGGGRGKSKALGQKVEGLESGTLLENPGVGEEKNSVCGYLQRGKKTGWQVGRSSGRKGKGKNSKEECRKRKLKLVNHLLQKPGLGIVMGVCKGLWRNLGMGGKSAEQVGRWANFKIQGS